MFTENYETEAARLTTEIADRTTRLRALAYLREPVTINDLCPDRCNVLDPVFERDVSRFMADRMPSTCVDNFDTEDMDNWARLDTECQQDDDGRYELSEIEVDPDTDDEDTEGRLVWTVTDTQTGDAIEFDDEDDARDFIAEQLRETAESELYGFPFAHNYCWEPDHIGVEDLAACGFIVYRYIDEKRSTIVAGIDGGGYSFMGQHFVPLYLRLAARKGWFVETSTGPRRVAEPGAK